MLPSGNITYILDSFNRTNLILLNSQWGEIKPEQWQEMFHNLTSGGSLNSIWHGIDEHCSSNIQCGAEACCLKPNLHGKRAITDGGVIHFGRYYSVVYLLIEILYLIFISITATVLNCAMLVSHARSTTTESHTTVSLTSIQIHIEILSGDFFCKK